MLSFQIWAFYEYENHAIFYLECNQAGFVPFLCTIYYLWTFTKKGLKYWFDAIFQSNSISEKAVPQLETEISRKKNIFLFGFRIEKFFKKWLIKRL